jgi:hypothetical protein
MSRTDTARKPTDKRRQKALAVLRDQRCRIHTSLTAPGATRAEVISAKVKGHLAMYDVALADGRWSCTCLDGEDGACAHAWAVRLVTGWAAS